MAKFLQSVEKRTGVRDVFVEPQVGVKYINSGSTVLNMLIGGSRTEAGTFVCPGYPRGKIVEVFGRESSGKSTIAMTAMAQALSNGGREDGTGLYVDLECAVVDAYAKRIGVDFNSDRVKRAQPHSYEETESLVMMAALNGFDFIVVDSVAGLVSDRETQRDVSDKDEKQGIAEIPRLMSAWMPKLQRVISTTGTTVMFLNQTRDKIGAKGFTEEALKSTTGGNALKFWASIRMLLKPKLSTKAKVWNPILNDHEEVEIATDIEIKMVKNKVDAKKGHSGLVTLRYGIGIDELRTMLSVADAYKIVIKLKNARKQDVFKYHSLNGLGSIEEIGMEKFRLALTRNSPMLQELIGLCQDKIVQGFRMLDDEELANLAEDAVGKKMDDDDDYEDSGPPKVIEGELEGDEGLGNVAVEPLDVGGV
jgi:recombination protein RecA